MRVKRTALLIADGLPRVRLTTHDPFKGARIGLTIWVGSKSRGWIGKPLNPRNWYLTWHFGPAGDE